ncbi:MAG: hypothetical protein AB4063_03130, partial [Crocosphaera sp.]
MPVIHTNSYPSISIPSVDEINYLPLLPFVPIEDSSPIVNVNIPYSVVIIGEDGDDSLTGTVERDAIDGRLGNDQISGLDNDDAISGNGGNDTIKGDAGNDILFGHTGNDTIFGGTGEDTLVGVDPTSGLGTSEKDSLRGDEGKDTFVLGDQNNVYYVDDDPSSFGEQDYGLIVDFTVGEDKIELYGTSDNYFLDFYTTSDGIVKADIVYDPGVAAKGELIAILEDVSADLQLTDSSFVYGENDYGVIYNEIFEPLISFNPGTYFNISADFTMIDASLNEIFEPLSFFNPGTDYNFNPGTDYYNASGGARFIVSGSDVGTVIGSNTPPNLIEGTSDDDILVGTDGEDIIYGYEGNDSISGLGDDDTIFG